MHSRNGAMTITDAEVAACATLIVQRERGGKVVATQETLVLRTLAASSDKLLAAAANKELERNSMRQNPPKPLLFEAILINADVRAAIAKCLKTAYMKFLITSSGRTMSATDRRGMFVTFLRNEILANDTLSHSVSFETGHRGFAGGRFPSVKYQKTRSKNYGDTNEVLLDVHFWSDAGVLNSTKLTYRRTNVAILEAIMSKIISEVEEEMSSAELGLDAMSNHLVSLQLCLDDATAIANTAAKDSLKAKEELSRLETVA